MRVYIPPFMCFRAERGDFILKGNFSPKGNLKERGNSRAGDNNGIIMWKWLGKRE